MSPDAEGPSPSSARAVQAARPRVSVVVPLYNEGPNVARLYGELRELADRDPRIAEIILVDDGSTDGTADTLRDLCRDDPRVVVVELRRNFGQTAALSAGFDLATGEVICPMDGDLQNDPADIPRLLEKIEEGFDVVSGWRRERKDPWLTRRLPSWFANRLISKITGVRLHDYGCALKAYRREVVQGVRLYGEMHRFIPSLASWMGVRVTEVPVRHRPRVAGRSKYGLSRIWRVLLDLINVKFLVAYATRPVQVFGKIGFASLAAGLLALAATVYMKFALDVDMTGNPLLLLSVLLALVAVQFVCIGLLGEIMIRTYYELQGKPTYVVRSTFRGGSAPGDAPARRS